MGVATPGEVSAIEEFGGQKEIQRDSLRIQSPRPLTHAKDRSLEQTGIDCTMVGTKV